MEACGFDAYDCSESQSQLLNATFVRFVSATPSGRDDPLLHYLEATYKERAEDVDEHKPVLFGRVSVNANSSYVSIDLSDLSRLGLILKSIEILDDRRRERSGMMGRDGVFLGVSFLFS